MEREEVETIPWSNLVMEPSSRFDRRWGVYAAAGVAVLVGVIGFKAMTSGAQPTPPIVAEVVHAPTTIPEAAMVVSEQDLRKAPESHDAVVALRAEWFVTDFFTNDGSPETDISIRNALHPVAESVDLAATRPDGAYGTFVEWAKVVEVEFDGTDYRAVVAFRALTLVGDTYRREPVRAAEVGLRLVDGVPMISVLPVEVDGFWEGPTAG